MVFLHNVGARHASPAEGNRPYFVFLRVLSGFYVLPPNIPNRVQNVTGFALDFGGWFIYIVETFWLFQSSHFFLLCLYL